MNLKQTLALTLLAGITLVSCNNSEDTKSKHFSDAPAVDVLSPEYALKEQGIGKFKDVQLGAIDEAKAKKGEEQFKLKCSACHKFTDEKYIGPGLHQVTKRRNITWILNQMTNTAEMLQKDPISKKLLETYATQMSVAVTDEEAYSIVEFLRKNDEAK